jgi:hypothetical protein
MPSRDGTGLPLPLTQCVVGETLCSVRVLSEAEFDALPPGRRPSAAEHVPGLGWVVALLGQGRRRGANA